MNSENDKSSLILSLNKPWVNNSNPIWIASTIGLNRNIDKFKYPGKLDTERRNQMISLLSKELLKNKCLKNPILLKAEEVNPLEKEFLVEHFFSNENFIQAYTGEAFVLDDTGQFIATLNLKDHLHLQYIDCQGEIESSWNKLVKIEIALGKNLSYSFSPKFGFLTSDFNNCGTALNVAIYLQLSGLIHTEKIDEVLEKIGDESIFITGIQKNPTEIIGDMIVLQNNYTLGVTEENIIANLRSFTTKILVQEQAARNQIRQSESADIKDKISRAYGILIHSYQIDAVEALNALSLIKLGVEMGWVNGITMHEINQLFFNCRRSHLLCQFPQKLSQEEIIHKRSEYIHKTLKEAHLTI